MNNTDLFEFAFVDREEQTKKVEVALSEQSFKNVIWINGKHGAGKSYFINHIIEKMPKELVVHIELNADNSSINCIKQLLQEIGTVTKMPFLSFFQRNYKVVSKLVQGVICIIFENITKIDIDSLCDELLDSSKIFTNRVEKQENSLKLVTAYIDSILKKQRLAIIIDDFSFCDMRSLSLIINLLQYYSVSKENNICFLLCTSHDDSYNSIEYQLHEKVILEPIEILPFDNYKYFNDILITKFNLATVSPHTLQQIFEFCNGYPERLKTFIHMLYSRGGIMFPERSDLAIWKNSVVEEIIYEGVQDYVAKDMPYIQQFILYIIVEFQKTLSLESVIDLANFLMAKNQFLIKECPRNEIVAAILELKQNGILAIYHETDKYFIKLDHDLKYYSFRIQFDRDPMMPKINGLFFDYVLENQSDLIHYGLSEKDIAELLAWHSYYGKATNWISYNIKLGNIQYYRSDYYHAAQTFQRLSEYWAFFPNDQKFLIGNCFFRTGHYQQAKSLLDSMQNVETGMQYELFMLLAQVNNLMFYKEDAVDIIDNKLLTSDLNELQKLNALNLKQRILTTIKGEREDARILFEEIKKTTSKSAQSSPIYGKFLMGTVEFYRNEIAEADLLRAEKIARHTDNQYLLAISYTNKGFHEFWRGNIDLAQVAFQESQERISSIRMHEISYPLNNLGVCYMMEGRIDNAINCFQLGLLWNQSKYVEITLKTLLMTCYAIQKNDNCFSLMEYLIELLADPKINDISIHIKVNYLIGFVYKCYGDLENFDEYRSNAISIASSQPQRTLPYIWFEDYNDDIEAYIHGHVDIDKYKFFYSTRFEPWLVTLNHD